MRNKIFLDLDGVIADFTTGYCGVHGIPNPFTLDPTFRGDEAWDVIAQTGMSPADFWRPMGRDFWGSLQKTEEADEIVQIIDGTVGMDNTCFLTTPCLTEGCVEGKRDWVNEHYPGIPILFSSAGKGSHVGPKEFCASAGAILIDDHTPNVRKWVDAGGTGFLFPRPWNDLHPYEDLALFDLSNLLTAVLQVDFHRVQPARRYEVSQATG
jgi:hypothetical protein